MLASTLTVPFFHPALKLTMQRIISTLFIAFLFTGCATTEMLGSLKTSEAEPVKYKKLGVVVLSPTMYNRSTVELAVADKLRSKGIQAKATFDIFPFAGKISEIRESGMDETTIQQKVRQRVTENELDAVLIITLFDKQKETHYVQGSSISIGAPIYGYPYYGYYGYAYSTVYSSGYYETNTQYFVETNLYDVATGKLIWTGQSKTENPESIEKEAPAFADIIVNEMLAKKALIP